MCVAYEALSSWPLPTSPMSLQTASPLRFSLANGLVIHSCLRGTVALPVPSAWVVFTPDLPKEPSFPSLGSQL